MNTITRIIFTGYGSCPISAGTHTLKLVSSVQLHTLIQPYFYKDPTSEWFAE